MFASGACKQMDVLISRYFMTEGDIIHNHTHIYVYIYICICIYENTYVIIILMSSDLMQRQLKTLTDVLLTMFCDAHTFAASFAPDSCTKYINNFTKL